MNYKIILAVILPILIADCAWAQRRKSEDFNKGIMVSVPATENAPGLTYTLPKTGLRFKIAAEKTVKKRGDFYLYSERYLGLKDVITEDGEQWRIKRIDVEPFGLANPRETFEILAGSSASTPLIHLSEDGVLLSVNTQTLTPIETLQKSMSPQGKPKEVPYTEEMLLANSSAKMAQEAATYIYRLRESRTALLSADLNTLPPDGEAYAMSLERIDALEEQFLSLFKGQETSTCVTEVIEFIPEVVKDKDVLFRFSSFNGLVDKDDLSGSPIFISMKAAVSDTSSSSAPSDAAGIYYKRPALVTVKIFEGNAEVLSQDIPMGQFGSLQVLPSHMLQEDVKVQLYPTTGALKTMLK